MRRGSLDYLKKHHPGLFSTLLTEYSQLFQSPSLPQAISISDRNKLASVTQTSDFSAPSSSTHNQQSNQTRDDSQQTDKSASLFFPEKKLPLPV